MKRIIYNRLATKFGKLAGVSGNVKLIYEAVTREALHYFLIDQLTDISVSC